MKNVFKPQSMWRIAGTIAVLAIVVFSMAACGGNDDAHPIIGTWVNTHGERLVFRVSGSLEFISYDGGSEAGAWVDNHNNQFSLTIHAWNPSTFIATLSGESLTVDWVYIGPDTFIRQQ